MNRPEQPASRPTGPPGARRDAALPDEEASAGAPRPDRTTFQVTSAAAPD
ncbi:MULTISPECIES: hypothetical protein [Sorangium]|nr:MULTISPECIES: hypothetical protein [Sorangium]